MSRVFFLILFFFTVSTPSLANTLKIDDRMRGEEKEGNHVWAQIQLKDGEKTCGLWSDYCPKNDCVSCVVKYLIADEREKRKLHWSEKDQVWLDKDGIPYDTETENKKHNVKRKRTICDQNAEKQWGISPGIWVVDTLGNFYTSVEQSPGVFHHSSFMAGGLVRAAGQIAFRKGKIIHINNSSGHYLPDQDSFEIVLADLHLDQKAGATLDVNTTSRRSINNIRQSSPARPRKNIEAEAQAPTENRDLYDSDCYNFYKEEVSDYHYAK